MKVNLLNKEILEKLGIPFSATNHLSMNKTDLDYIGNIIKKDKCFPLILSACMAKVKDNNRLSWLQWAYARINAIVFMDKFYNKPTCPKNVKSILCTISGLYRNSVEQKFPNLLSERYQYAERWLETVK